MEKNFSKEEILLDNKKLYKDKVQGPYLFTMAIHQGYNNAIREDVIRIFKELHKKWSSQSKHDDTYIHLKEGFKQRGFQTSDQTFR